VQFLTNVNINIPPLMAQGTLSAFLCQQADLPHLSPLIRQSNSLSMRPPDLLSAVHKRAFVDADEGLLYVCRSQVL
jgi:hypothetical protein